jgi:hypothetical protein
MPFQVAGRSRTECCENSHHKAINNLTDITLLKAQEKLIFKTFLNQSSSEAFSDHIQLFPSLKTCPEPHFQTFYAFFHPHAEVL